jgi:hypothetical protein
MKIITMHHILGNKVLEYDVDDRGVIVDEREIDRTVNHKPNIADWVKEHMVFWYDMSKPVDVYAQNFNDWQNYNPNSVSITNNKIVVNGLIDNFRIASIGKETESFSVFIEGLGDKTLVYRVKLDENSDQITNIKLKDGENVLPHSFATTVAFMGVSGVTDYIGLTITQLPSGQSVPTNEILKANPYLQDHSGNNRPLKLNNFLFAAMSGVGGYTDNFNDWTINSKKATVKLESSSSVTIQAITQEHIGVVYKYENGKRTIIKVNITGITEEIKGRFAFGYADVTGNHNIILENGYFEFDTDKYEGIVGWYGFKSMVPINICNITIEQIPVYPNALVTDGVDDYGVVENLQQGVKVLFMTAIPLGLYKTWYAQDSFSIYGQPGTTAYNFRNTGGVTYLDGILNEAEVSNNLLNKKKTVTIVNPTDGGNNSIIFFNSYGSSYMSMAFYNSIGFDSVPTKETDGFTEQDLINYVLENIITQ